MTDRIDPLLRRLSIPLLPVSRALLGGFLALCLLTACSSFSSNGERLPDTTFTKLLTELHVAAARQNTEAPSPPNLRDSILARYDVRPSAFEATLEYYSRHPEAFELLYQSVTDTLQALQYTNEQRNPTNGAPDSLSRAKQSEERSP